MIPAKLGVEAAAHRDSALKNHTSQNIIYVIDVRKAQISLINKFFARRLVDGGRIGSLVCRVLIYERQSATGPCFNLARNGPYSYTSTYSYSWL
jgi:hypothetical protein